MSTAFWIFVVLTVLFFLAVFRIFKPAEGFTPMSGIVLAVICLLGASYSGVRALDNYKRAKPFSSNYSNYLEMYQAACGSKTPQAFPEGGTIPGKINFLRFDESGKRIYTDLELSQEMKQNKTLLAQSPAEMNSLIVSFRDYSTPSGVMFTDGVECKLETVMLFIIDPKTGTCLQQNFTADKEGCAFMKDRGDDDNAYVHTNQVIDWVVQRVVLQ